MKRRVLIAYLVRNSGHHSAARAIEYALHQMDADVQTLCVDLLAYTHPRWSKIIQKTYMGTIRRTPEVWEALYDSPWVEYLTRRIRALIQRGTSTPLLNLMDDFKPDVVVCTQAHPFAVLCDYARRHHDHLPVWGVVTDFVPHRFWVVEDRGRYVVPDEAAADRLSWLGVERERIAVRGIPVNVHLSPVENRAAVKPGERRVLVMGGSRGLGVRYRTVRSLDRSPEIFTIDVISGTNNVLRRQLIRHRHRIKHSLRVRGYVRNAVALMHRASLLVSKPGGLTTAEAMAIGLPMVIVRPLPGQERGNAEALTRYGAAVHVTSERALAPVVTALLRTPRLMEMMRERALAVGRPDAASKIAELVLTSMNNEKNYGSDR